MQHVFISYSRRNRASIDRLVVMLRDAPDIQVWIDERDIPVSVPWLAEIEDAIRGAALILVCESLEWHGSRPCLWEDNYARQLRKPILYVDSVTHDPAAVVAQVRGKLAEYRRGAGVSELLVRAARWESGGRQRSELASRRALRSYKPVVAWYGSDLPADAQSFVRRSRAYNRRQRLVTAAGLTLALTLFGTIQLFNELQKRITSQVTEANKQLEHQAQSEELAPYSVYAELEDASRDLGPTDTAFSVRDRLTTDLDVPLPVKFTAPRSTETPVAPFAAPTRPLSIKQGALRVESDGLVGSLTIFSAGKVIRRIALPAAPSALALNHAGTFVAANLPSGVAVARLRDGATGPLLRGFPRAITSLRWSNDDATVTATATDGMTAAWKVTTGTVLEDDADNWYMGLAAARGTGTMAAITRDGRLLVLDLTTRQIAWRGTLGPGLYAGIDATPTTAVIARSNTGTTPSAVIFVDLHSHSIRRIPLPGCTLLGLATGPDHNSLAVACGSAGYGYLDISTGQFTAHATNLAIVSAAWIGQHALFGTIEGTILETRPGGAQKTAFSNDCFGGVTHIATTPDGHYLFHSGEGSDLVECLHRGTLDSDGKWSFDHIAFRPQPARQAGGLAVSPDGRFVAWGFADGTIHTSDTDNLNPRTVRQDARGQIRGLAYSDDGRALIAVTRDGAIIRYATATDQMTVGQLAQIAAGRVKMARDAGVYSH
jgi:WD40 repeat protein